MSSADHSWICERSATPFDRASSASYSMPSMNTRVRRKSPPTATFAGALTYPGDTGVAINARASRSCSVKAPLAKICALSKRSARSLSSNRGTGACAIGGWIVSDGTGRGTFRGRPVLSRRIRESACGGTGIFTVAESRRARVVSCARALQGRKMAPAARPRPIQRSGT